MLQIPIRNDPTADRSVPRKSALLASAMDLKAVLQDTFSFLEPGQSCALLNYPDYINIGDHLIWAGTVSYLRSELDASLDYATSRVQFCQQRLESHAPEGSIFLLGGGNFGDLWYGHQAFREYIIQTNAHRPIIILPQTIYFQNPDSLENAARIFNAHPNLTVVVRDQLSFEIATQHFDNCRVFKAPDMALYLAQRLQTQKPNPTKCLLYHCRRDSELHQDFLPDHIRLQEMEVQDWTAYEDHWLLGHPHSWLRQMVAMGIRSVWQRGLRHPHEWRSRHHWDYQVTPNFADCYDSALHYRSWSFMHSGVYQFQQYRAVITNRLQGHILCVLLGIPHVFLPNGYHKNQSYYDSWCRNIPFCRFVKDPAKIPTALDALGIRVET